MMTCCCKWRDDGVIVLCDAHERASIDELLYNDVGEAVIRVRAVTVRHGLDDLDTIEIEGCAP